MPLSPNTTLLQKYRIEALIGEGAFGEVYRVTHLRLGVTRALKILRADAPGLGPQGYSDAYARFQLEAQLGAQLNTTAHPHLIPVYAVEEYEGMLLLEMEYESNGSLKDRLAQYKQENRLITLDEAIRITQDIAAGLAVIHQHDIVHRDLKPSNILFGVDGRSKIADFGLAEIPGGPSMRSRFSQPTPHPGTPSYMSPEQESDGHNLTPSSDIYAVGIILFEMLTERAYKNLSPGTRAKELRREVPDWLDDLLAQMLAPEPKDRPWDGGILFNVLRIQGQGKRPETPHLHVLLWLTGGLAGGLVLLWLLGSLLFHLFQPIANAPVPTIFPTPVTHALQKETQVPPEPTFAPTQNSSPSAPPPTVTPAPIPSSLPSPTILVENNNAQTIALAGLILYACAPLNDHEHRDICAIYSDGSHFRQLTFNQADDNAPSLSPDGQTVAFHSYRSGHYALYLMPLVTGEKDIVQITSKSCDEYAPDWSPDGGKLVFHSKCDGNREIVIINHQGENREQLTKTKDPVYNWYPRWSPDGTNILFTYGVAGNYRVVLMANDGSTQQVLADGCDARFSPDGQFVLFSEYCTSEGRIFLMPVNGSAVPIPNVIGREPAWSPDGQWIVYRMTVSGSSHLFIANLSGTTILPLTSGATNDEYPTWYPMP